MRKCLRMNLLTSVPTIGEKFVGVVPAHRDSLSPWKCFRLEIAVSFIGSFIIRRCLAYVLLTFGGIVAQPRSQVVLEFEPPRDLVQGDSHSEGVYGVEEDGFVFAASRATQFVNGGGLFFRDPSPGPGNLNGLNTVPYNGSHYAVPFTSSQPVLRHVDSQPFQLLSMELAPYSADFSEPNFVAVTGYDAAGGSISLQLTWSGQVQGQASDFRTFAFGDQWKNLQRVELFASTPRAAGIGFSIDNVRVSVVPEPGPLALLGLGLAGMVFARRVRSGEVRRIVG